jgi:DNA-binding MarR family transcriptional regulator
MAYKFTEKQGQFLAFIYYYTKIHRQPPAESDLQKYFRVTPPSIHQMVVTLTDKGLISRVEGQARTIKVLVPENELPKLKQNG